MKKIIGLLMILMTAAASFAQQNLPSFDKQPVHFGFAIGYNSSNLKVIKKPGFAQRDSVLEINPKSGPGFNIGIVTNVRLTNWSDLRFTPYLSFTDRSLDYVFINKKNNNNRPIESTYIVLPVDIKIRSIRHRNVAFYVVAGFNYSFDVISQKKITKDEDDLDITTRKVKLNATDFSYEWGFGWDLYYQYFKFSPEIKFSYGMKNLLKPEDHLYSKPIDKLFSRVIVLTLYFEG